MNNYLELPYDEKIELIKSYKALSTSQEIIKKSYLMAVYKKDTEKIKEFENRACCHGLRGIIDNSVSEQCSENMGYVPKYNDYGWVISHIPNSDDDFSLKFDDSINGTAIRIKQIPNKNYIYSYRFDCHSAGGSNGFSIFNCQYKTFDECLISALENVEYNMKPNCRSSHDFAVLKKVQAQINDLKTPLLFNLNEL